MGEYEEPDVRLAEIETHRSALRAMCYRMLGTLEDADEVVQDTFVRALERAPDSDRSLAPWLRTVAMNLARDRLRSRRRRSYKGQWLPQPATTAWIDGAPLPIDESPSAEVKYDQRESASYAFLVACEVLTPNQRAAVVLRDVLGCSVQETALALECSASNARVTHLRARRRLAKYDGTRQDRQTDPAQIAEAFGRLMAALMTADEQAVRAALRDDVVSLGDGGGVYAAAGRPVRGVDQTPSFLLALQRGLTRNPDVAIVDLNGVPGLALSFHDTRPHFAPHSTLLFDVDRSGSIVAVWSVLAPAKQPGS